MSLAFQTFTDAPAMVRADAKVTSIRAAQSVTGTHLRESQADVYDYLRWEGPATSEQLLHLLNIDRIRGGLKARSGSRVRTAIRELVKAGLVKDSGRTSRTAFDREATIWEVA